MKDKISYSPQNPPTNVVAANIRLEKIKSSITQITSDLKNKEVSDFLHYSEYEGWYDRAQGARSYLNKEYDYVATWIQQTQETEQQKINRVEFDQELAGLLNEIVYKPLFDEQTSPPDQNTAFTRRRYLVGEKIRIEGDIVHIKNQGVVLDIYSIPGSPIAKKLSMPLKVILREIDRELMFVNRYLAQNSVGRKVVMINKEVHEQKKRIGTTRDMLKWVYAKMGEHNRPSLCPADLEHFTLIGEYIKVSEQILSLRK